MNNYKLKKCEILGINENESVNVGFNFSVSVIIKHHIIMKKDGGTFKNGFIYLCGLHHRKIYTIDNKIIWKKINETITNKYINIAKRSKLNG